MPLVDAKPRIALQHVLVATDFSEFSAAALPFAADLARRYHAKLFLAHIVPPEVRLELPLEPVPLEYDPHWQRAEQHMTEVMDSPLLRDLPHESLLRKGDLWPLLEKLLADHQVDLLVMGTHGRGGVRKLLLGSVAEEIARQATCPVLTVGPDVPPKVVPEELRQVLFATDFLPGSLHALPYALCLAEHYGGRLTLLHALPIPAEVPMQSLEAQEEDCKQRLRALLPDDAACETTVVAALGPPAEVILAEAQRRHADLIVMGVRPTEHPWTATHLAWVTVHRVIAHAHCPVLTVRG